MFCALVNGEGEVTDFLRLPHFTKRRTAWREEEREKKVNLYNTGHVRVPGVRSAISEIKTTEPHINKFITH